LPFILYANHDVPAEKLRHSGVNLFLPGPVHPIAFIEHMTKLIASHAPFKATMLRPPCRQRERAQHFPNPTPYVYSVARFSRVEL
jgi:hypothetical protein